MIRPRLTIRLRLTLVYGGLFVAADLLLLGATYLLVSRQLHSTAAFVQTVNNSSGPEADPRTVASQVTDTALSTLLVQGGAAMLAIGTAVVTLGWLVAGRLLRPLHLVTRTARRIADAPHTTGRGLHERIELDGPRDEITELADTFDEMLERLDHAFDAQSRFIANASHELRTPLTLNRALLEVAVHRNPRSEPVQQLGTTLLEINSRHERLVNGLLLLAQSERDLDERSYVDLADVADHVVTGLPSDGPTVHVDTTEAPVLGSPVLLERLAHNLVENALRYNLPDNGWVRLETATTSPTTVTLRVTNTGPPVSRLETSALFEPFRRLGTDRLRSTHPGTGLGLSIVRAVARAHGGNVEAVPRTDGGLTVTVSLPKAPTSGFDP
jgi:signal transduction histidine kinase